MNTAEPFGSHLLRGSVRLSCFLDASIQESRAAQRPRPSRLPNCVLEIAPLRRHPSRSDDDFSSYAKRIRKWLDALLREGSSEPPEEEDVSPDAATKKKLERRKKLLAVSFFAVVLTAYLRFSKRRRNHNSNKDNNKQPFWPIGLLLAWWNGPEYLQSPQSSTMSLLWNAARDGVIQRAMIGSSAIFFQTKRTSSSADMHSLQWNRAVLPLNNNDSFKTGLLEALTKGGCTDIQAVPESIWSRLATPVLTALPFVYLLLVYRMMKTHFGGEDINSKLFTNGTRRLSLWGLVMNGGSGDDDKEDRTTFEDVAGLALVVEDMREVVSYLSNPTLYNAMGARPPKGVFLHGPPGSGKTLLARAIAGEARCDSFTALSGSSFVEMYVGRGAARVRSLFAKARRDALNRRKLKQSALWWSSMLGFPPSTTTTNSQQLEAQRPACAIIFIDEFDAVAKARSKDGFLGNDEREQTLNQLLTEMDGFDSGSSKKNSNDSKDEQVTLIVIAASNRLDVIDEAVLRRFDRQIFVGYPDAQGREEILLLHAKKTKCSPNVDWTLLASDTYTDNFSGADLQNVVNHGALNAIREKRDVVEQSHLVQAAQRIQQQKAKVGRQSMPSFLTLID
ncbi:zinc metalloprotease FTSH, chloroplastic [Seminavis robusta]|uniref:Zinc metalloprotease FTSH, chloroplastic n=1 Tax=Seminavis robusta TaxID=568900 RepID=A0A9N8HS77_9STRA|nr:zinc metalloprotease FTSH, chloroplastic [Seminavis robusta]|eukprot:Sro1141_g245690.1 zinc metalloprotease FTSH, chloroplastic (619) ;mRNA; f:28944-30991